MQLFALCFFLVLVLIPTGCGIQIKQNRERKERTISIQEVQFNCSLIHLIHRWHHCSLCREQNLNVAGMYWKISCLSLSPQTSAHSPAVSLSGVHACDSPP